MTVTCRDVVKRALRKLSRTPAGQPLDADDLADGIEVLQAIYLEFSNLGVFGRMYDKVVEDATYDALPQQRIVCNRVGGVTVTLPDLIDPADLSWLNIGCGDYDYGFRDYYCTGSDPMPPRDLACIQIADLFSDTEQTWVYNGPAARWIALHDLSANSPAPLGTRYSDGIAAILADRLLPEFAIQLPPDGVQSIQRAAAACRYAITHRYDSPRQPAHVECF